MKITNNGKTIKRLLRVNSLVAFLSFKGKLIWKGSYNVRGHLK
jgi:hypothetical protein